LQPSLRARREVPGQARDGVSLALAAFLALLPLPARAQILPTDFPAADIILTQALAEQRVFLTCSALDPAMHEIVARSWAEDVQAAQAIMAAEGVTVEAAAAFTAAARSAALMPAADTPWTEVRQLCDAHRDWPVRYGRLDFTILRLKLPAAFE
jgi:hypothetical protein